MLKNLSLAGAALIVLTATLSAQSYPDTFKVNYYANANEPCDETVRITNVGTQTGTKTDPSGDLYAAIYIFDPDQELQACCAFPITPDGLLTLSVNENLLINTLTGEHPPTGAIKILSSTSRNPAKPVPASGIRAWVTHLQNSGFLTETESSDSTLSAGELASLEAKCSAIQLDGSGAGICTCAPESH
jgi:hypothetical protein